MACHRKGRRHKAKIAYILLIFRALIGPRGGMRIVGGQSEMRTKQPKVRKGVLDSLFQVLFFSLPCCQGKFQRYLLVYRCAEYFVVCGFLSQTLSAVFNYFIR